MGGRAGSREARDGVWGWKMVRTMLAFGMISRKVASRNVAAACLPCRPPTWATNSGRLPLCTNHCPACKPDTAGEHPQRRAAGGLWRRPPRPQPDLRSRPGGDHVERQGARVWRRIGCVMQCKPVWVGGARSVGRDKVPVFGAASGVLRGGAGGGQVGGLGVSESGGGVAAVLSWSFHTQRTACRL